jgi:lipopolysaccharide transport system ATP-binding protein
MKPAIKVDNLSKLYHLGTSYGGYQTLRERITQSVAAPWRLLRSRVSGNANRSDRVRPEDNQLWALKDVSVAIERGEVVGVIGRNGAGKSTFLKILSRITEPTSGRAELRGRVGSLLEVGTGFHTELTGRENIYLSGAICGMTRREIAAKFDDIVAFAEVDRFLDTPVKRYSSGMYVRLAFAVASHMESEILLVDEVLAVGDAAFQKKCLGKMDEVSHSGRTVLFVSHNMATILNLCKKTVLFEHGRLSYFGDSEEAIRRYRNHCSTPVGAEIRLSDHPNRRNGCTPILGGIRIQNHAGELASEFSCGEAIRIEIAVTPNCLVAEPDFAIGFEDTFGRRLLTAATYLSASSRPMLSRPSRAVCQIPALPLAPGHYYLTLNAGPSHARWTDVIDQAASIEVTAADYYGNGRLPNPDWGRVLIRSQWETIEDSTYPTCR